MGASERQKDPVLSAPLRVGDEAVAYTLADAAYGSNPSRGWGETRRPMDATARSPGAALRWRSHSIDTVRAKDKGGNCGCWPHTRRAGSHRLLCAAHAPRSTAWPDSARSHLVGGQSLAQRSGPLSRAERLLPPVPLNRSLRGGLLVRRWERGSKLGGAHLGWLKHMTQLQTEVPDPLRDDLPYLLTICRMADPAVGVLFLVFIS